jgi:hypothetical protein
MKRCAFWSFVAIVLSAAVSLVLQPLEAQTRATATNVPVIPHVTEFC